MMRPTLKIQEINVIYLSLIVSKYLSATKKLQFTVKKNIVLQINDLSLFRTNHMAVSFQTFTKYCQA